MKQFWHVQDPRGLWCMQGVTGGPSGVVHLLKEFADSPLREHVIRNVCMLNAR